MAPSYTLHSVLRRSVKNKFTCEVCNKKFNYRSCLNTHMLIHSGEEKYEGKKFFESCKKKYEWKKSLNVMKKHPSEKSKECQTPKKKYFTDNGSNDKIHSGEENNYECDICMKKFCKMKYLDTHKGNEYLRDVVYECKACKKKYSWDKNLKRHMNINSGEGPKECEICKKKFFSKNCLLEHMKIHLEESKECQICQKKCYSKSCLIEHMKLHLRRKINVCKICKEVFVKKGDLICHMAKHAKTYKCDVCNIKFYTNCSLSFHKKVHTEYNSFMCDICNKIFCLKSQLEGHVQIHAIKHVFQCSICCDSFTCSSSLQEHVKMHASDCKIKEESISDDLDEYYNAEPEEDPLSCVNGNYGTMIVESTVFINYEDYD